MAKNLSAIAKGLDTLSEKEARWAGWDPELEVPVVEMLGYEEVGGTARLNRVSVSSNGRLMVSGAGTGSGSSPLSADSSSVSAIQSDAGLLRVSSIGGSFSLSADASGNRVSAVQTDAANLMISAKSQDAGLMRVSAVGGSTVSLSADASGNRVSAVQESAANLLVSAKSDSAGQLRISAFSNDAALMRVSSVGSGSFAPLSADSSNVSAIQEGANRLRVSALVDSGSISAKSGDANQLHTSSVQGDAALLRVSAIGGTAGDNVLVDGTDQSISAKLIQVSASVSSSMNTLLTRMTSYDAANAHVSSYQGGSWTLSAFINEGTISARSTDAGSLLVSGKTDSAAQFRVSAFVDSGSISAKAGDASQIHVSGKSDSAGQLRVSAFSDSAALFRVSALGVTLATAQTLSATLKEGTAFVGSVSANQAGTWAISALAKEGTSFIGNVSAKNADSATNFRVSTFSDDAALMRVSSLGGSFSLSADASGNRVSAVQTDAANLRVSALWAQQLDAGNDAVSAKSSDAGTMLVSAKQGDAGLLRVSSIGGSFSLSADAAGNRVSGLSDSAGQLRVSSFSDSAATFRVSALGVTLAAAQTLSATLKEGTAFVGNVSAKVWDGTTVLPVVIRTNTFADTLGGILAFGATSGTGSGTVPRQILVTDEGKPMVTVSAKDANEFHVSSVQGDAALQRTSADLMANTVGALTVFQTLSVSASQNVKSTAGAIYGYYLYNSDTKMNYVKFYNVSAAVNVGTDTPILTVGIPASAAANVEFPHGLVGFTNGIGIAATSGRPVDNTTAPAASAVGLNLFYK